MGRRMNLQAIAYTGDVMCQLPVLSISSLLSERTSPVSVTSIPSTLCQHSMSAGMCSTFSSSPTQHIILWLLWFWFFQTRTLALRPTDLVQNLNFSLAPLLSTRSSTYFSLFHLHCRIQIQRLLATHFICMPLFTRLFPHPPSISYCEIFILSSFPYYYSCGKSFRMRYPYCKVQAAC